MSLREQYRPGDPEELGRLADRTAHEHVARVLAARHPEDAVRSEEAEFRPGRGNALRVWIVDPLDGTREYVQGRDDWGVNIALAVNGQPVAAAMAVPAADCVLTTMQRWDVPRRSPRPRMLVSRSHTPPFATALAARIGAELRTMGSVAAKAAAVFCGEAEIYLHAGGMFEWDSAAAVALAGCCGMHASRLDGRPLRYGRPDPWLPDLLICLPELAEDVLGAAAEYLAPPTEAPASP